jgi:HAD superfamily hydrolase (TIGR01509 family)
MSDTQIRAIVFDVDGTLLDTHEFILQAFEHALASFGRSVGRTRIGETIGLPLRHCYELLAPDLDHDALCGAHRAFQKTHFDLIASYPGLRDLLEGLRAQNIRIGLCSSRGVTLIPSVKHAGISHLVDAIVDESHVTNHKPHPDSILLTAERIGILAAESVMVGDTRFDIAAGRNAGCAFTVGITHGFGTEESLREAGADVIVHSLAELAAVLVPH